MDTRNVAQLPIYIRDCVKGEILTEANECKLCYNEGNKYSFDTSDKECQDCPADANCLGGDKVFPKRNYWRSSKTSEKLYKCKIDGNCLGGADTQNQLGECNTGYKGRLCTVCDDDYSRIGLYECAICPES